MKISTLITLVLFLFGCNNQHKKEPMRAVLSKDTFNFGSINLKDTFTDVVFY